MHRETLVEELHFVGLTKLNDLEIDKLKFLIERRTLSLELTISSLYERIAELKGQVHQTSEEYFKMQDKLLEAYKECNKYKNVYLPINNDPFYPPNDNVWISSK